MLTEAVHLLKPSFLFVTFPLLWLWRGLKTSSIKKENLIVRTCVTYDNWAFDWRAFRFGRCRRSSAAVQLQKPIIIIVFFFFLLIALFIYLEGLGRGIQGKKKKGKTFFFFFKPYNRAGVLDVRISGRYNYFLPWHICTKLFLCFISTCFFFFFCFLFVI